MRGYRNAAQFSRQLPQVSFVFRAREPDPGRFTGLERASRVKMTADGAPRHDLSHLAAEDLIALSGNESKLDLPVVGLLVQSQVGRLFCGTNEG